jgi:hypothetical protein
MERVASLQDAIFFKRIPRPQAAFQATIDLGYF